MPQPPDEPPVEDVERLPNASEFEIIDLDALSARQVSVRKRFIQTLLACLAVALALATFWRWLSPALQQASTAPVVAGYALIESNVSYGTLTLNGEKQPGSPPLMLTLRRGANRITLTASPFHPLSCQIAWPQAPGRDTCHSPYNGSPFNLGAEAITVVSNGVAIRPDAIIAFSLGLADLLPTGQTAALSAAAQTLADAGSALRAVVPNGQYFATSVTHQDLSTSMRADGPLLAVPVAALDLSAASYNDCGVVVCPELSGETPDTIQPARNASWVVEAHIVSGWRFLTNEGALVAEVRFPWAGFVSLALSYDPGRGWSTAPDPLFQTTLASEIAASLCNQSLGIVSALEGPLQFTGITIQQTDSIQGCKLELDAAPTGSSTGPATRGAFLWRFGVLLAADEQAHGLLPLLPLASPEEIAAVGG